MSKNDILKKAEEYMKLKYRFELTEDEAEGGYVISYPDLIGCISSGETVYPAPRTAAARGLNRTTAARRTALPPLL